MNMNTQMIMNTLSTQNPYFAESIRVLLQDMPRELAHGNAAMPSRLAHETDDVLATPGRSLGHLLDVAPDCYDLLHVVLQNALVYSIRNKIRRATGPAAREEHQ